MDKIQFSVYMETARADQLDRLAATSAGLFSGRSRAWLVRYALDQTFGPVPADGVQDAETVQQNNGAG